MNKVDLIFEKQPPQVQKKLMNLLIQYNAIMKYNKNSDQFQVDFLLPFQSQKEKKQFLNKFQSRTTIRSSIKAYKSENKNQSYSGNNRKNIEQFKNNDYETLQDNFQVSQESGNISGDNIERAFSSNQDADKKEKDKDQEQQISYDFTLSNENDMSHAGGKKSFSVRQISSVLKNKIINAVSEIRNMGGQNLNKEDDQKIKNNDNNYEQFTTEHNYQRNKQVKIVDSQKEESVDEQNSMFNLENERKFRINPIQIQMVGEGKERRLKNKLNPKNKNELGSDYYNEKYQKSNELWIPNSKGKSRLIIENERIHDIKNIPRYVSSYNQNYGEGKKHQMQSSGRYSERSSEIKNQILIEDAEQPRDQEFEGNIYYQSQTYLEDKNKSSNLEKNDKKNIEMNNSKSSKTNEHPLNKIYDSSRVNQAQLQNMSHLKQRLTDRYGTRKVGTNLRQKYVQFVKKNHQQFGRIYENIRKDLRRNENQLNKSRKQDPILVLEQDLNYSTSEEDRLFKEQIIKDYHKHIIAHNQNMSSEDLVRYFRYLLQHAKNLYIKHLRKGTR